jgi:hypothetical protein
VIVSEKKGIIFSGFIVRYITFLKKGENFMKRILYIYEVFKKRIGTPKTTIMPIILSMTFGVMLILGAPSLGFAEEQHLFEFNGNLWDTGTAPVDWNDNGAGVSNRCINTPNSPGCVYFGGSLVLNRARKEFAVLFTKQENPVEGNFKYTATFLLNTLPSTQTPRAWYNVVELCQGISPIYISPENTVRALVTTNIPTGFRDDKLAGFSVIGTWPQGGPNNTAYNGYFRYHAKGTGTNKAIWTANLVGGAGDYEVFVWYPIPASGTSQLATNAPFTITYNKGLSKTTVVVNQQQNNGKWVGVGRYYFGNTGTQNVTLTDKANGYVLADAVKFVKPIDELKVNLTLIAGRWYTAEFEADRLNNNTEILRVTDEETGIVYSTWRSLIPIPADPNWNPNNPQPQENWHLSIGAEGRGGNHYFDGKIAEVEVLINR